MCCNGKYTGGGMIIDPFACLNDGLVDVTWINDPAINNLMGVAGMLDDAGKRGGAQAYKGQNTYMRGRKVRAVYKGRDGNTEQ